MGRRRIRNLLFLGGHEIGGVEPVDERREEVRAEFGIRVWANFESALQWNPDAVVVSTPPDRHAEFAIAAARSGIPFFTEASVVTDGMDELLETLQDRSIVAAPSCTMRFNPAVRLMKERLEAGAIGRPLAFTHHVGQYLPDWHPWEDYRRFYVARRETGAAREIVPFELNWLTFLFGRVRAAGCLRGKLSDLDADIDDVYVTLLEFETGLFGSMVIEVISRPAVRRARIIGEEGTLEWDWTDRVVREWKATGTEWQEFRDPPPVDGPGGKWVAENMYIEEMRAFLGAVEDDREPYPFTVEEDYELLRVLLELERRFDPGATRA
jgi:predicted dehydrogenase